MKRLLFIWMIILPLGLSAQYFGRNKVSYEQFPFGVLTSPHFELYHYFESDSLIREWANHSEAWYITHQKLLKDTLKEKNPIILYANHAHFQQTRTISAQIGVGTGGVTEALKNRVVMPLTMTQAQSHHVLGHELVHAFQYHMILSGDSTNLNSFQNLPLWLVEGLAEYLSIGRIDPHTAMWMRDAYLHDRIPPLNKLYNTTEYFPYRYGQAFWAYLTGTYGDTAIRPFFMATAKGGFAFAAYSVLHVKEKDLSQNWQTSLKAYYGRQLEGRTEQPVGEKLISEENGGRINVSPALSPDGRHLIFYSEKDLFTVDLFLADARTGKVLGKLASTLKDRSIDDFPYIESSGCWSPDSRQFAFIAIREGRNYLIVKEVSTGKTRASFPIEGVPALSNPAWSPDGRRILFSGLAAGRTDLYLLELSTRQVERLTNDPYSEIQGAWSPDGKKIVFATDQLSRRLGSTNGKWTFNLAVLDLATKAQQQIELFLGADNLNPQYDNHEHILFLSDRDGFRNIYRFVPATGEVFQMTDLLTGVSGLTAFAPAIHIGNENRELVYIHYFDRKYTIYKAGLEQFTDKPVDARRVDRSAAALPPFDPERRDLVLESLNGLAGIPALPDSTLPHKPYRPKFKLDYVGGGGGIGIGANSSLGNNAFLSGGVDLLFGDMLGYHQLYTGIFLSGDIYDFGGVVAYLNQKHRLPWGVSLSHLPYRGAFSYDPVIDTIDQQYLALRYSYDLIRIFEEQLSVFAYWPFSRNLRTEFGGSFAHYSYRIERYDNYYDLAGDLLKVDRKKIDAPDPYNLANLYVGLVGDNSHFGLASPMQGHRFRIGFDQYFGKLEYRNVIIDARKYYWLKPFSLGGRLIYVGRYGPDARQLTPMYVGDPLLVRGYGYDLNNLLQYGLDYDQLMGSKMAVVNAELRLPLSGPEQIAVFPSRFLFSELAFFLDGGGAWDNIGDFKTSKVDEHTATHEPIFSMGLSWRVNLFGALVVEPYYAIPIQKDWKVAFGINLLTSGW